MKDSHSFLLGGCVGQRIVGILKRRFDKRKTVMSSRPSRRQALAKDFRGATRLIRERRLGITEARRRCAKRRCG